MPVFFTFLNTRIWWGANNQAVAKGITGPICMPLVTHLLQKNTHWLQKIRFIGSNASFSLMFRYT